MKSLAKLTFLVALLLLASGCVSSRVPEEPGDIQASILELERRLVLRPDDAAVLRDLGSLHVRANEFARGSEYLKASFERNARDPKTVFYLALASESLGNRQAALRLYARHADIGGGSRYQELMRGRYEWLSREIARHEVSQLVKRESDLSTIETSTRRVAVFPLNYLGEDARYGVLGRGLSELVVVDLGHVRGVNLVERIRLQALLDELALSEDERVDPATAPRAGRLLGAGRIVGGSFDVLARESLKLNVALWDSTAISSLELSDDLENLFRLEKQLVFNLLTTMGIEPSPEEIQQIEFIPTRNLQAFLAFCRGLDLEDRRDFAGAARYYSEAVALDPAFGLAAQSANKMEGMNVSGPTTTTTLREVTRLETGPTTTGADLVDLRLQNLGASLRMNFNMGLESRESATDIVTDDGDLPDPPPPPPR